MNEATIEAGQAAETGYRAVDEVNQLLSRDKQVSKGLETVLVGSGGQLDSLGLINLIVAIEQKVEEEYGRTVTLADERAMGREPSPFTTMGALVEYVAGLLREKP
jgi:acyl carrier protein